MRREIIRSISSKKGNLLFKHVKIQSGKTQFFTDKSFLLQVGHLQFEKGYTVRKHKHVIRKRTIPFTAEVLLVTKGRIKYYIWDYENTNKLIARGIARKNEILILGKVGHSFYAESDVEIIEIKQGPYLGSLDKIFDAT